eukprot:CAMPEP_0177675776 /NCGR_PEP_ID=MMETSP0447-20121125/27397_1 /TAXON_ID=0 /ORGANISM="Stygamoeba regulata, Strain BSH-02190019" /LENGTH=309 /DNA_ID=CAMNT_0019184217 /DNA_START=104 /DNA_END=1030 /DNA_ORIENTATION=-
MPKASPTASEFTGQAPSRSFIKKRAASMIDAPPALFHSMDHINRQTVAFARIKSIVHTKEMAAVFTSADEDDVLQLPASKLFPLHTKWLQHLGDARRMQDLVSDPINTFMTTIRMSMKRTLDEFLRAELGEEDYALLERAKASEVTPGHIILLERMQRCLRDIITDRLPGLSACMTDDISQQITHFITTLDEQSCFLPRFSVSVEELRCWPVAKVLQSQVVQYSRIVESSIELVRLEFSAYLSGEKLHALREAWHSLVTCKIKKFLAMTRAHLGKSATATSEVAMFKEDLSVFNYILLSPAGQKRTLKE